MNTPKKDEVVFIRIPAPIKRELQEEALEQGRTLSGEILFLLKRAMAMTIKRSEKAARS